MIIYLYCADIWERVRVTSARQDYSFVIFQWECSVSQKRKKERKRKDRIFFPTLITLRYKGYLSFSLFNSKLLFFFDIEHNHISICQCVHMLSMQQTLSLKVAVKCSFLETDVM
jgi:hypothetical protein